MIFWGFFVGWLVGIEPTAFGTTNQRSVQLSYNHSFRERIRTSVPGTKTQCPAARRPEKLVFGTGFEPV